MAELDQNQIDTETGAAEATQTPLDTILDTASDVPAQEREAEAGIGGMGDPQVPLVALRKERERRKKSDRQVEELRVELQKFEDSKYGFDQESVDELLAQQPASDVSAKDPVASNYDRSMQRFTAIHGKDVVAKVDAGLKRLNVEQRQHVVNLAGQHPDPVAAIHAYVGQLDLLDHKNTPMDEVLAARDKPFLQARIDTSQLEQHIAQLNQYGQAIAETEYKTRLAASQARFFRNYDEHVYNQIDGATEALMKSGHPVAGEFRQAVLSSPDPVSTAAQILHHLGVWQPQNQQQPQQRQQTAFPSDLVTRRSVGQRGGPGYAGPRPLEDIFRH